MEETQMLVEGCNRVSTLPPFRHPTVG
jgi:hypothetical protein